MLFGLKKSFNCHFFLQRYKTNRLTDRPSNRPTRRLLELLWASKNTDICIKAIFFGLSKIKLNQIKRSYFWLTSLWMNTNTNIFIIVILVEYEYK